MSATLKTSCVPVSFLIGQKELRLPKYPKFAQPGKKLAFSTGCGLVICAIAVLALPFRCKSAPPARFGELVKEDAQNFKKTLQDCPDLLTGTDVANATLFHSVAASGRIDLARRGKRVITDSLTARKKGHH
jgi:hypothetical protein